LLVERVADLLAFTKVRLPLLILMLHCREVLLLLLTMVLRVLRLVLHTPLVVAVVAAVVTMLVLDLLAVLAGSPVVAAVVVVHRAVLAELAVQVLVVRLSLLPTSNNDLHKPSGRRVLQWRHRAFGRGLGFLYY
jgi:hypothetical protein